MPTKEKTRCGWIKDPLMREYHDREWGVPLYKDRKIFEFMLLDSFQAGLSWAIVLKKRKAFKKAFAGFDPKKVARFTGRQTRALLRNPEIVRNRLKISAAVTNARQFLKIQKEYGKFSRYIWQFAGGKPKVNRWRRLKDIPASSPESDAMSRDLSRRGFKFVGSTICYAFMQAAGMVNDHVVTCFRHAELSRPRKRA